MKWLMLECKSGRSLIYISNKSGPRIEHWGTPQVIPQRKAGHL